MTMREAWQGQGGAPPRTALHSPALYDWPRKESEGGAAEKAANTDPQSPPTHPTHPASHPTRPAHVCAHPHLL